MAAHFLCSSACCLKTGSLRLSTILTLKNKHKFRKLLGIKHHFPWPCSFVTCKYIYFFQYLSPCRSYNTASLYPRWFSGVLSSPLTAAQNGWQRILYALTIKTPATSDPFHTSNRMTGLLLYSGPAHLGFFFPKYFIVLQNVLGDGSADSSVLSLQDHFHSECSLL